MSPNNSKSVFNATAATYDRERMKLIPGHERFYAAAVALIPTSADHILDLGAGTGLFTAMIRSRFPDAYLHLIDISEPMLEQARARFLRDQEICLQVGDYTTAPWGSSYDAIVSALSIHHLEDDRKQALFTRIFSALKPGGVFINADHIAGPTPQLEELYQQRWLADVHANGATEQQVADSLFRQQEDRRAPVEDQLAWMRAAGFAQVDCHYKDGSFAVLTGARPAVPRASQLECS
jgi:tRNA (cmo5U34)-methyltransferase